MSPNTIGVPPENKKRNEFDQNWELVSTHPSSGGYHFISNVNRFVLIYSFPNFFGHVFYRFA